jgi:hypothetical protein
MQLREKVETLPIFIQLASKKNPLTYCSDDLTALMYDITDDDLIWKTCDRKLMVLISPDIPSIYPSIVRGQNGLVGLVAFLEHLVRDRKFNECMLTGKVERLMKAIN